MGAKMFTGDWKRRPMRSVLDAQTKYNLATAPSDGTPAKVCKFFNTYLLTAKMATARLSSRSILLALHEACLSSTLPTADSGEPRPVHC